MGTINFAGAGTGIDWNALVEAQIQAQNQRFVAPLQKYKTSWEDKLSAYDELRSLLTEFQDSVEAIDTPSELRSYTVSSTDEDAVSATVSGTASPGSHTLEVNQLAAAETEVHSGLESAATIVNNSDSVRTFAYTYGGEATSVAVASGTMLSQLAGLINNDPNNPGVTASVLDDGSGSVTSHHLVLRGQQTGAEKTLLIDADGTTLAGEWSALSADAPAGTSSFTVSDSSSFNQFQAIIVADDDSGAEYHIIDSLADTTLNLKAPLAADFTQAQNAYVTVRGMGSVLTDSASAGAASVSVADTSHFTVGSTVVIADANAYEELTIAQVDSTTGTLTFETNLTADYAADAFVTQLSGGRKFTFEDTDFTEVQAAANAQLRVDGYPGTGWIERDSNVVDDVIDGVTLSLRAPTGETPVSVTVNEDMESVKAKISEFVDAYNAVRSFINVQTDYDPETGAAGKLMGSYAASIVEGRLRDIVISEPTGFDNASDTYTLPGQIGIEQVGSGEDSVLGTLTLDESKLEEALIEDFQSVIRLFSDHYSGYSNSQYLTFYQASELNTVAGTYEVEASFDGGGNLTAGRFRRSGETTWRDASVDGTYLLGQDSNPEDDLWVRAEWDGSSTTQTATVRVTQGVASQMSSALESMLSSTDGLLHNINESYQDIIDQVEDKIGREQERLERLRESLTAKYARLEQYMVQMQGQQQWSQSMAASLAW